MFWISVFASAIIAAAITVIVLCHCCHHHCSVCSNDQFNLGHAYWIACHIKLLTNSSLFHSQHSLFFCLEDGGMEMRRNQFPVHSAITYRTDSYRFTRLTCLSNKTQANLERRDMMNCIKLMKHSQEFLTLLIIIPYLGF